MLLCKNRRLFTVAGDNFHVLTPIPIHLIPIPIPWLILLPFPWESHGIPVFPIPMHTSTAGHPASRHTAANASTVRLSADVDLTRINKSAQTLHYPHWQLRAMLCSNQSMSPNDNDNEREFIQRIVINKSRMR